MLYDCSTCTLQCSTLLALEGAQAEHFVICKLDGSGDHSTTDYPSRDVEDDVSSVSSFSSTSRASPLPYGETLLHFPGDSGGSV
ncbi:unnamed protein product [Phyllotreta striolata]|uniref:Uncharacterized protein n=1 Tax=Phyllotreta striolata TaxID=444603 RepID=A0A9N9TER4_PHYSR|nr:unnamed protein product [Phyllotreta striolata]